MRGELFLVALFFGFCIASLVNVDPRDERIEFFGRVDRQTELARFDWSGVGFSATVSGAESFSVVMRDPGSYYTVYVNGMTLNIIVGESKEEFQSYVIWDNMDKTKTYNFTVVKRTEAMIGVAEIKKFVLESSDTSLLSRVGLGRKPQFLRPVGRHIPQDYRAVLDGLERETLDRQGRKVDRRLHDGKLKIEWIGDSLSCGYGNLGTPPCHYSAQTQNELQAFPYLTSAYFGLDPHVECWSGKGVIRNYGDHKRYSEHPFPDYYPRTVANDDTVLYNTSRFMADIVVIVLGSNDYSTKPHPVMQDFVDAYLKLIEKVRTQYPKAIIFLGTGVLSFDPVEIVKDVVRQANYRYKNVHLVDFTGVIDPKNPEMFGCDWHPSVIGHIFLGNKLIEVMGPYL